MSYGAKYDRERQRDTGDGEEGCDFIYGRQGNSKQKGLEVRDDLAPKTPRRCCGLKGVSEKGH